MAFSSSKNSNVSPPGNVNKPVKPKFKSRELLWMTLPVLVIGGVAWWKIHQPTTYEISTTPPEDLNQGPMRLVMAEWKPQPPNPSDIATGHTLKWGTRFWFAGRTRGKVGVLRTFTLTNALNLQYRKANKWHLIKYPGGWNGLRVWLDEGNFRRRLDVALPMNLVPQGTDKVRLHGFLQAEIGERIGKYDYTRNLKSSLVDISVKIPGAEPVIAQTEHQSPLTVEEAQVHLLGDAANERLKQGRVNARIQTKLGWSHPLWRRDKPIGFATQKVQLLDERGHDWLLHASETIYDSACENIGDVDKFQMSGVIHEAGPAWWADVQTSSIPRSAGELRLRALVAPEWKGGYTDWPVQVESVVRPRWLTRFPRDLKVQKVSVAVQKVESATSPTLYPPIVSVDLQYTGTKPLFPRGESEAGDCGASICWEDHELSASQIPFGEYISPIPMREAKPGENELIVSWSQRVEDETSHSLVPEFSQFGGITVLQPQINKDHITVKYVLNAWNATFLRKTFHADIGLRNQGMIPIAIDLPIGLN
ncbi:hypothetical protein IAD21_02187 [Abditibacteriota bacterium]|nr:hypothetical protein IAD21_02187 [Abditibacteriota bacterium]